uniref:Cytochrome P450 4461K1 n=1 Tax=Maconellicoccus hirsutus TaxID=177089 RepID=A0AAT9UUA4_MACHI
MIVTVSFMCLTIAFLYGYFYKLKHRRFYQLLEQFPSYPRYPIIGNLHLWYGPINGLLSRIAKTLEPHDHLLFWMGPAPRIILKKPVDIMAVLNQCPDRDSLGLTRPWTGTGILSARYEEWKKSKKILMPVFSSEMLSKYADIFNEKSIILVDQLKPLAQTDHEVDVWNHVMNINIEIIVENMVGISLQSAGKSGKDFGLSIARALQSMTRRFFMLWLYPQFIYSMYLKLKGQTNLIRTYRQLPSEILENKLNELKNKADRLDTVDSSKLAIDLLIKRSLQDESFDKARMTDELLQLIGAGMETTALNECFLLLMLAIHQDIQQKVYEEITQLVGDNDTLTPDQMLNELKYLEQCIKETARLYSPVVLTTRRALKDCVLNDNKIIPAGTFIILYFYFAHYDKEIFNNPQKWDPENFTESAEAKRPAGSALIFGYGPHTCPGAKYAMMSVKTQITNILREYHLSTNIKELTDSQLKVDLCVRSRIGYPIKFTSRRKPFQTCNQ